MRNSHRQAPYRHLYPLEVALRFVSEKSRDLTVFDFSETKCCNFFSRPRIENRSRNIPDMMLGSTWLQYMLPGVDSGEDKNFQLSLVENHAFDFSETSPDFSETKNPT